MRNPRHRLPLTALRTFEAAARLQSFKDAADELCVTPTTVSNQIRQLERDWGRLLFVRKTRQVVLTDTGRSLARVVGASFEAIRAEIEGQIAVTRKPVTLAVGPIFASRWLIPRLGRFRAAHPGIELILHHGPRITSAENMTTPVAIDWGHGDWTGLDAHHLFGIRYVPVLSPALAAARGGIARPGDLLRFPIIHQHDRTEWNAWAKLAGLRDLETAENAVIDDSNVVTEAAIDGQGVALGIFPFLDKDVAHGRLIRPFDIELEPTRSYHLLVRHGALKNAEIAALCEWLRAEGAASRFLHSKGGTGSR